MSVELHIDVIRQIIVTAKEQIARDRLEIIAQYPLVPDAASQDLAWREHYAFIYLQAERMGLAAIQKRLDDVQDFMTTRLDTSHEVGGASRSKLKNWVRGEGAALQPELIYGNAFVHVLTRAMMTLGPDDQALVAFADRMARLFRDLACVISIMHCCGMLADRGFSHVPLVAPRNLASTARELAHMVWLVMQTQSIQAEAPKPKVAEKKGPKLRLVYSNPAEEGVPAGV
ncbi:MAG: hypothetical protein EBZ69_09925 [Alphaproteobacteria bacterium]|nr:hypothetical protein [Alphaproteobacteria bacterium]NDC57101.1 hypothetical protein [Alphaproteobacteria bacterium]NDG04334.1 hypothetical protein [Alphaproteobacteria bacterium]